jgi:hypothetical protein
MPNYLTSGIIKIGKLPCSFEGTKWASSEVEARYNELRKFINETEKNLEDLRKNSVQRPTYENAIKKWKEEIAKLPVTFDDDLADRLIEQYRENSAKYRLDYLRYVGKLPDGGLYRLEWDLTDMIKVQFYHELHEKFLYILDLNLKKVGHIYNKLIILAHVETAFKSQIEYDIACSSSNLTSVSTSTGANLVSMCKLECFIKTFAEGLSSNWHQPNKINRIYTNLVEEGFLPLVTHEEYVKSFDIKN